jgi:hypothetical protein
MLPPLFLIPAFRFVLLLVVASGNDSFERAYTSGVAKIHFVITAADGRQRFQNEATLIIADVN